MAVVGHVEVRRGTDGERASGVGMEEFEWKDLFAFSQQNCGKMKRGIFAPTHFHFKKIITSLQS